MRPTYSPRDYGSYYVEPYCLIGHDAADVMAWVAERPECFDLRREGRSAWVESK